MYQLIYNHISQSNQIMKQRTTATPTATTTTRNVIIIECSNKWARPIDVCVCVCELVAKLINFTVNCLRHVIPLLLLLFLIKKGINKTIKIRENQRQTNLLNQLVIDLEL